MDTCVIHIYKIVHGHVAVPHSFLTTFGNGCSRANHNKKFRHIRADIICISFRNWYLESRINFVVFVQRLQVTIIVFSFRAQ